MWVYCFIITSSSEQSMHPCMHKAGISAPFNHVGWGGGGERECGYPPLLPPLHPQNKENLFEFLNIFKR